MCCSAQSTLKARVRLDFHPLWTLVHLVPYHLTTFAHNHVQGSLRQLLKQAMRLLKVLVHKYFWVVICTSPSLLTVAIHVIPTQFPNNVLVLALSPCKAKSHVKIRTAFVNVPERTVLASTTSILNKILTNF